MTEILKKINTDKLKNKNVILIITGLLCIVLLFAGEMTGDSDEESRDLPYYVSSDEYIRCAEDNLTELLGELNGVGKVKVMLTLENCYENVYAKGYSAESKRSGDDLQTQQEDEYIIVKKGGNNEECLIVKVYEPTVKGVAVVAEGAGNVNVKNAIIQTVCALYDISSVQVSVEEMNRK